MGWISLDRKVIIIALAPFPISRGLPNTAKTGRIERERQPIYKKLKLLLLFNPLTEWVDTTQTMRLHAYKESVTAGMRAGLPLTMLVR